MNGKAIDGEFFPAVEMDAGKSPGLVFFQDRETRYTVVCDAESGNVLGRSACGAPDVCSAAKHREGRARVLHEVRRWQQR